MATHGWPLPADPHAKLVSLLIHLANVDSSAGCMAAASAALGVVAPVQAA